MYVYSMFVYIMYSMYPSVMYVCMYSMHSILYVIMLFFIWIGLKADITVKTAADQAMFFFDAISSEP